MNRIGVGLVSCVLAQDLFLARTSPNLFSESCSSRATPSEQPLEQLCYLLKKNRDTYDISWAPPYVPVATFQDHIPYDLVAQYLLGASAQQLNNTYVFHEHSEGLMPAIPSSGAINETNWMEHIGENAMNPSVLYSDYVDFYREQVQKQGARATLHNYLPSLVDGVFGKLFHGMQTLGWGYGMTGDIDMIAQGLAWMSTAFSPPAALSAAPKQSNLTSVFEQMHEDTRLPNYTGDPTMFYGVYLTDLIVNYSTVLTDYDLLVSDSISLVDAEELAQQMSDAVMNVFAAYNFSHFTNVHYSGSIFAMKKLLAYGDSKTRAVLLRRMWQAIVYNYGIQSHPSPALPPLEDEQPTWENILERSFNQTDVHIHELTYYTMKEHHNIDDKRLRQCADRALRLFENGGDWSF
jgi:hypothetical protein